MDLKEKFGIDVRDEVVRASIRKACLKVRVAERLFYVPFGQVEAFLKMSLPGKNDIVIYADENSDFVLD